MQAFKAFALFSAVIAFQNPIYSPFSSVMGPALIGATRGSSGTPGGKKGPKGSKGPSGSDDSGPSVTSPGRGGPAKPKGPLASGYAKSTAYQFPEPEDSQGTAPQDMPSTQGEDLVPSGKPRRPGVGPDAGPDASPDASPDATSPVDASGNGDAGQPDVAPQSATKKGSPKMPKAYGASPVDYPRAVMGWSEPQVERRVVVGPGGRRRVVTVSRLRRPIRRYTVFRRRVVVTPSGRLRVVTQPVVIQTGGFDAGTITGSYTSGYPSSMIGQANPIHLQH